MRREIDNRRDGEYLAVHWSETCGTYMDNFK
jgi:hypothetical protein